MDQIDGGKLSQTEDGLQQLEQHKSELEARISQVTKDLNVVISTEKTLAEKVKQFQSKCSDLQIKLDE